MGVQDHTIDCSIFSPGIFSCDCEDDLKVNFRSADRDFLKTNNVNLEVLWVDDVPYVNITTIDSNGIKWRAEFPMYPDIG